MLYSYFFRFSKIFPDKFQKNFLQPHPSHMLSLSQAPRCVCPKNVAVSYNFIHLTRIPRPTTNPHCLSSFFIHSVLSVLHCSLSSFCTLLARPLFWPFSSTCSYCFLLTLQPNLNFPFSGPCSGPLPPTLSIGSHYNPPYSPPHTWSICM